MIRQMLVIDEDDIMSDIETQIIVHRFGISIEELNLSKEMSDACIEMARRIQGGEAISYEQLTSALTGIGEQYGCEYGVPLPSISPEKGTPRDVVMARGTPLRQIIAMNQCRTELECDLLRESGMGVLNSWDELGDRSVSVIQTHDGPIAFYRYYAGHRLRKIIETMSARMDSVYLSADAELRALESLKAKLTASQYRSYILNGMFPERSKRSDLFYMFRKGYPTIVMSYHHNSEGKVLCCLCLHPFGYYAGTWAGMMTPTDEVIAAYADAWR